MAHQQSRGGDRADAELVQQGRGELKNDVVEVAQDADRAFLDRRVRAGAHYAQPPLELLASASPPCSRSATGAVACSDWSRWRTRVRSLVQRS